MSTTQNMQVGGCEGPSVVGSVVFPMEKLLAVQNETVDGALIKIIESLFSSTQRFNIRVMDEYKNGVAVFEKYDACK